MRVAAVVGKSYEYPRMNRAFQNVVLLPICTAILVFSVYLLVTGIAESSRNSLAGIIGIIFSGSMIFGFLFNYFHLGTIVVNERDITSLRRLRPSSIAWKDIQAMYYLFGRGKQVTGDPFFTVYIFSNDAKFIVLDREIEGIRDLMDTIRQYADASLAREITFSELVKILFRHYVGYKRHRRNAK